MADAKQSAPIGSAAEHNFEDRLIRLAEATCQLPERLLLAHARGEVLFITGAGISLASGLPDFRQLVLDVYEVLDRPVYEMLKIYLEQERNGESWTLPSNSLTARQLAELRRFTKGDYDVVLGMLERRIDSGTKLGASSKVRNTVCELLRAVKDESGKEAKPAISDIHSILVRLGDRGTATTIVTTNFDVLLEKAKSRNKPKLPSFSLGEMPRPSHSKEFAGILHIHGRLSSHATTPSEIILTDEDFGEYYLRRRTIPDFIYDAARLFHLVLVGYSANDAPMRYLLNAVAADGSRFSDLRERFAFVGLPEPFDPVEIEDWKGRGITPIPYVDNHGHKELTNTLNHWAMVSAINGKESDLHRELKRIVKQPRSAASEADCDLFDHLVRRSSTDERARIARFVSAHKADIGWLSAILAISREFGKVEP